VARIAGAGDCRPAAAGFRAASRTGVIRVTARADFS
jgi:hypothetical protein